MGFEDIAYRYAIKNAFLHEGKADINAVVGKVIALKKDLDFVSAMPRIKEIVKQVNAMGMDEIKEEYGKFSENQGYELKPKEKEEGLPSLEWAEKGEEVIARLAPNPSGPMHLGHARQAIPNWSYAEKYKGKFILKFDDTDPKIKKPMQMKEAIKSYTQDLEWLGVKKIEKIYFASDRIERHLQIAGELMAKGKAYVCTCDSEKWRSLIREKKACSCRLLPEKEQMQRWEKMLKHEFKEGEAVARIKTELENKDPSVRDWWLAKIVDNPEHSNPKTKGFHVWPSYNLASAIDDHDLGITLIIRGQEHAQNATKQKFLYDYFGWKYPHAFHTGRIRLEGSLTSKSKIKKAIQEGDFSGLDDPRIGNIATLRRRGISPEAIEKIILSLGLNTNDAVISIDALYDANRKIIDPISDRISFVQEAFKLEVQFCPKVEAKIPVHPDFPEKGEKVFQLKEGNQEFLVSKSEVLKIKTNDTFRLRTAYNAKLTELGEKSAFAHFTGTDKIDRSTLVWLLPEQTVKVEITMPDGKKIEGIAEKFLAEKKQGDHVLLEKFGYCIIDEKVKSLVRLWYSHK
ncbi:MAG: glutamate--tRNA ligase [Candidatus Diapherotrites archaeon]|uniref:Glutamate--tRNA ligase n=2 Tax=Candidatus Iainarchaeum sp. TaxID=3101447 RepID=A0A8T4KVY8_9ARCH|nr:glutamate--tRNA ligase [Candidatus Diapherotrites archaeon]